jgi:acylphosphatase
MAGSVRAQIIVNGLVQGVGFRYFVARKVNEIGGLTGYVKNLYTGEVQTVVEGERALIETLFAQLKTGPRSARVNRAYIEWSQPTNEFTGFEITL